MRCQPAGPEGGRVGQTPGRRSQVAFLGTVDGLDEIHDAACASLAAVSLPPRFEMTSNEGGAMTGELPSTGVTASLADLRDRLAGEIVLAGDGGRGPARPARKPPPDPRPFAGGL